ncbi:MAG TPA: sigma factor-like helix-turn-helix DNA-binding protein [Candidatus Limnocylindria bacterium]
MSVIESHERSVATALQDEDLYKRIFRALVAVGASTDEASDALQDAYEQALRQSQPLQRVEGWLFVVAQRRWRRQRIRRLLFRPLNAARGHVAIPIEPGGVLAEVRKLPMRQRQVFVARHVLGLSNDETAKALGIADGTVSATNHHALHTLRKLLGGEI